MIYLLYATKVNLGGWATFTRHLYDALSSQRHNVCIVKIGNRTEDHWRPFGDAGHAYRNMDMKSLRRAAKNNPMIVAALGKHYVEQAEELMKLGAKLVIHDTAESGNRMAVEKPWVIRKALRPYFPGAVFIRHPYEPHTPPAKLPKRARPAVATSRVDFDKNTKMILDANRLGAGIDIVGFENRLYTRFKIMPDYPEWQQSPGTHPRTGAGSYAHCLRSQLMVDLTDIKGDGGGTQYTFLEAWDAGAVPVIGSWWLRENDDMKPGINCLPVSDAKQLALLVKRRDQFDLSGIADTGRRRLLSKHCASTLVPRVVHWLEN